METEQKFWRSTAKLVLVHPRLLSWSESAGLVLVWFWSGLVRPLTFEVWILGSAAHPIQLKAGLHVAVLS